MSPDDRRKAIVGALLPLLVERGGEVSTREIAQAAGIAEGTIFRVFETKDELIDAALSNAFDPAPLLRAIGRVDAAMPLRERLVAVVTIIQDRFVEIFELMRAVGLVAPPEHHDPDEHDTWRAQAQEMMLALIEPDADRLRVPPAEVLRALRLLTFAGSHAEIADHHLMTPDEIVDVVLHGTLAPTAGAPTHPRED
jgi:AcrR family transcriptional regulator